MTNREVRDRKEVNQMADKKKDKKDKKNKKK